MKVSQVETEFICNGNVNPRRGLFMEPSIVKRSLTN